jgi:hypothetical protein
MDNPGYGQAPAKIEDTPVAERVDAGVHTEAPEITTAKLRLAIQARNGANWFYWVAGLSLVNSLASVAGINWRFLLGLGVTQVVDAVVANLSGPGRIAGFVVNAFVAGFFFLMGSMATKLKKWAFVVGMVLFFLDGGVELLIQDWLGLAFHAYVLYRLFEGYRRLGEMEAMNQPNPFSAPPL